MRRRDFITLLGGAGHVAARGAGAAGQQGRENWLDLVSRPPPNTHRRSDAFRAGLRNLGYVEGENFQIEFRFADGDNDLLPGLATELVRLNVDVIVTYATGVPAARRATTTIPIVMATYSDAVATRIVASLAHPGGHVTGSTFFNPELMAKRLELLKEVVPAMKSRVGVFLFRGSEGNGPMLEAMSGHCQGIEGEIAIDRYRQTDGVGRGFFNAGQSASRRPHRWGSRAFHCQCQCDHRSRREAPTSFDWAIGFGCERRADGLRGEFFRSVSPCRRFRRQDSLREPNLATSRSNRQPSSRRSSI